jgi:hypothetical protein
MEIDLRTSDRLLPFHDPIEAKQTYAGAAEPSIPRDQSLMSEGAQLELGLL